MLNETAKTWDGYLFDFDKINTMKLSSVLIIIDETEGM